MSSILGESPSHALSHAFNPQLHGVAQLAKNTLDVVASAEATLQLLVTAEAEIKQKIHTLDTRVLSIGLIKSGLCSATPGLPSVSAVSPSAAPARVTEQTSNANKETGWERILAGALSQTGGEIGFYHATNSKSEPVINLGMGKAAASTPKSMTKLARAEALTYLQNNFIQYFLHETDKISAELELSPERSTALHKAAEKMAQDIVNRTLTDNSASLDSGALYLSQMVFTTHKEAQYALIDLYNNATKKQAAPEIFARKDGSYTVLEPAPAITNLVLRGGGMKGIGYIGVVNALERLNLLPSVQRIAGTSAGAINAACIAVGMSATELKTLNDTLDMQEQMGTGSKASDQLVTLGKNMNPFAKSATRLLETLDVTFRDTIERRVNADIVQCSALSSNDKQQLLNLLASKQHSITFGDLRRLTQAVPGCFKELTLVGYDSTHKKVIYFNADTYPDLAIAAAARISMSIPFIFKPVYLDGKKMVDGGVGSNLPTEAVNPYASKPSFADALPRPGISREDAFAQTMAFSFDENGEANKIQFQPNKATGLTWIEKILYKIFVGSNGIEGCALDQRKFNETGPNGFIVEHGDLGTTDFGASRQRIEFAQTEAELGFLEQIRRSGQSDNDNAVSKTYKSIAEVVQSLSPQEISAISQQNRAELGARDNKAALALYDAVLQDLAHQGA